MRQTLFRTVVAAGLGACALLAQHPSEEADDSADGHSASVYASVNSRGDLRITAWSEDLNQPLGEIVRQTLGCESVKRTADWYAFSSVCRHRLSSHGGLVNDTLRLAPLVAALRKAGAVRVDLSVSLRGTGQLLPTAGSGWLGVGRSTQVSYRFVSKADGELPEPLAVHTGREAHPTRLVGPLLLVLLVPALVALWLERRGRTPKKRGNNTDVVWLNWILLGSWVYWITAASTQDITDFTSSLPFDSDVLKLILGAALFSIPPLLSTASCLIALAPRLLPEKHSSSDLASLLKRNLAGNANTYVPLGIFLIGMGSMEDDWRISMGSVLAAYLAYKIIGWWAWRWSYAGIRAIDAGELLDRVTAIAGKAGVQLKKMYLLRNRLPHEANAFALSGQRVMVTESLLQRLTKREVDAVMAHEVGHLQGRHVGVHTTVFWICVLLAGPGMGYIITKAHLPEWILSLPIVPLTVTLLMAYVSQRNEFSADAKAAQLTEDPEAKIAALARLAQLTKTPLQWGGIQGSILSHPSMQNRVLSIARRSGVPDERALALLENPDLLDGDSDDLLRLGEAVAEPAPSGMSSSTRHYSLPPDLQQNDPLFNTSTKMSSMQRRHWLDEATIVGLLFGLAYLVHAWSEPWLHPRASLGAFLLGLPLVFWLHNYAETAWDRHFMKNMRRQLGNRMPRMDGGVFISLRPGEEIRRAEGFFEWDLGFMILRGEYLTFRGERSQFSIPRSSILGIELRSAPRFSNHGKRVLVRWQGGSFTLQRPEVAGSRRVDRKLCAALTSWWTGIAIPAAALADESLPLPSLPVIQADRTTWFKWSWFVLKDGAKLLFGSVILSALLPTNVLTALVPFVAPILFALSALPSLFASLAKVTTPGQIESSGVPPPLPEQEIAVPTSRHPE